MKKFLLLTMAACIMGFGVSLPVEAQNLETRQVFPGVACTDSWATALYILADTSNQGNDPRYVINATFAPAGDNDTRYTTSFDLADMSQTTFYTFRDFICENFPGVSQDSGTLVLESDVEFHAWHMSYHRGSQYGSAIPASDPLQPGDIFVWFGDTVPDDSWRFNVFLYNDTDYPATVWVNNDLFALEPNSGHRITGVDATGLLQVYQSGGVHAVVSQVNNLTSDAVTVPLIAIQTSIVMSLILM